MESRVSYRTMNTASSYLGRQISDLAANAKRRISRIGVDQSRSRLSCAGAQVTSTSSKYTERGFQILEHLQCPSCAQMLRFRKLLGRAYVIITLARVTHRRHSMSPACIAPQFDDLPPPWVPRCQQIRPRTTCLSLLPVWCASSVCLFPLFYTHPYASRLCQSRPAET